MTKKDSSVVALPRFPRSARGAPVRLRLPVTGARKQALPWRLSGLLSGCPPTDTRPQARAKLGEQTNMRIRGRTQAAWLRGPPVLNRLWKTGRELERRAGPASAGERLDAPGCADEARHHHHAGDEEDHLEHVDPVGAEAEQARQRPAAGERRAEHFGADQDRGAEHRDDVGPVDPPAERSPDSSVHCVVLARAFTGKVETGFPKGNATSVESRTLSEPESVPRPQCPSIRPADQGARRRRPSAPRF